MEQQTFQPTPSAGAALPTSDILGEADAGNIGPTTDATTEHARSTARNIAEHARSTAENARSTAQDLARRARERTSLAAGRISGQSVRAGEYLARNVNEYPLPMLLACVAAGGAIGYGLAFLIHGRA